MTASAPQYWPLSDHIRERIKHFEADGGPKLRAYRCPAGVWTIGWGATGRGVTPGATWTVAQCEARFEADLREVAMQVTRLLRGSYTNQHQFEALVSLAYNEGAHKLEDSTLMVFHRAGNFEAAKRQFARWVYAGDPPRKLAGLVTRRAEEAEWYALH